MQNRYIVDLEDVRLSDLNLVGGKNASLGEMIQNLSNLGVDIPSGFAITVDAYWDFILHNKLDNKIKSLIKNIKEDDIISLNKNGLEIRQLIQNGEWPEDIKEEIKNGYTMLSQKYGSDITDVAVRSSATAEDLPNASFAGQQETYLNVRGVEEIFTSVRNCFSSLFTNRAISYRDNFGFDHFDVGLSVCIQKMVRSDLSSAGVAFSLDTESGFKDVVLLNGSYGLGELVVQGMVSPDEFLIFKPTLKNNFSAIIEKKMGKKSEKMIYSNDPGQLVKTVHVSNTQQDQFCITDKQALQLANWVCIIEDYYTKLKGHWCPIDVEWAIDGLSEKLFIVQARPETIHSRKKDHSLIEYILDDTNQKNIRLTGIAVGDKIGQGKVQKMFSLDGRDGTFDAADFKDGDVLVTEMTDPDWEPIMKRLQQL